MYPTLSAIDNLQHFLSSRNADSLIVAIALLPAVMFAFGTCVCLIHMTLTLLMMERRCAVTITVGIDGTIIAGAFLF